MLRVNELYVSGGQTSILRGVSLTVERGACIGLTGPSGSGKTTLLRTILGMGGGALRVDSGELSLDGADLLALSGRDRRALCGTVFGFIPQNPMTSFFPSAKVGGQVVETFRLHTGLDRTGALALAEDCLRRVNLTDTARVLGAYPGQLSGGMLQRVTMAILLGTKPAYILADEPTSALDTENRDLLLALLRDYGKEAGILFLSHDAEAMQALCSTTYVMLEGAVIEAQPTRDIFEAPVQPWTQGFAAAAIQQKEGRTQWKRSN